MATQLINFKFSINGTEIIYASSGEKTRLVLDAAATCEELKSLGAIEDFAIDRNGEPVVLYSDANEPVGYGFEPWCLFLQSFPFNQRVAEIIVESREDRKAFREFQNRIIRLLSPLKAA